jgi:hypothetical protein
MKFFVPAASNDELEERYAELARFAKVSAPSPASRVFSLQWEHDGEVWEATVGEQLVRLEPRPKLQDNATVLAIFPGNPYMIVTTAVPLTRVSSHWNNPISIGVPLQIKKQILFDVT